MPDEGDNQEGTAEEYRHEPDVQARDQQMHVRLPCQSNYITFPFRQVQ